MNSNTDFILLISGINDNDRIVKQYSDREHPIYYKSHYVPPYERFDELKKLLLRIKSVTDLSAENTIAIDLFEWIGHEQDEFFTIMLKFLHDHRGCWKYIFTVGNAAKDKSSKLFIKLKTYLRGHILEDQTFFDNTQLREFIVKEYALSHEVAGILSQILLADSNIRDQLGYELLDNIVYDLKEISGTSEISIKSLSQYLYCKNSVLYLLSGRTQINAKKGEEKGDKL